MQTEEYWTHTVAKYGGAALRPPAIAGRTSYKGKKGQGAITIGADFGKWIEMKGGKMKVLDLPDTGDVDEEGFWWEARRSVRRFAMRVAERQRVEWRMEWCGRGGELERESGLGVFGGGDGLVDGDEDGDERPGKKTRFS